MSQTTEILNYLRSDFSWHSAIDIAQQAYHLPDGQAIIARVASRIFDIRKLGYSVDRKMDKINGVRVAFYRLIPEPQAVVKPTPAQDKSGQLMISA